MSYGIFNWIFLGFIIFSSVMVMVRFAFYKDKEQSRYGVYLWGGVLFMMLGVYDLSANLFFGTPVHKLQNVIVFGLMVWTVFRALRNRRALQQVNAS